MRFLLLFPNCASRFQFQSGAIQWQSRQSPSPLFVSFNSKVVRFNVSSLPCTTNSKIVSIPKWCDSMIKRNMGAFLTSVVSIPKWCDSMKKVNLYYPFSTEFQFQSGAIQCKEKQEIEGITAVSIPKWCDSMQTKNIYTQIPKQFQFQSGAIQCSLDLLYIALNSMFQFQSGAIQWLCGCRGVEKQWVSIPKWCDSMPRLPLKPSCLRLCFNSKVVRFNVTHPIKIESATRFQFQSGAIQWKQDCARKHTYFVSIPKWCDSMLLDPKAPVQLDITFQFQSGAIQCTSGLAASLRVPRFNSKVVRFNAFSTTKRWTSTRFQFQSGAIQCVTPCHLWICQHRFQFQSGAIQCNQMLNQRNVFFMCFNSKVVRFNVN